MEHTTEIAISAYAVGYRRHRLAVSLQRPLTDARRTYLHRVIDPLSISMEITAAVVAIECIAKEADAVKRVLRSVIRDWSAGEPAARGISREMLRRAMRDASDDAGPGGVTYRALADILGVSKPVVESAVLRVAERELLICDGVPA